MVNLEPTENFAESEVEDAIVIWYSLSPLPVHFALSLVML